MNLDRLKKLHSLSSGRWCDTCLDGGMDSERQEWPCDTAELLYTLEEIRDILHAQAEADRIAYEAWVGSVRAGVDVVRREDPEAFWRDVAATEKQIESMRAMRKLWSKEIAFQATPILRYSRLVNRAGDVDDHLQTGQFAR